MIFGKALRVQEMFQDISFETEILSESEQLPRPDPAKCGIRYMLTDHGRSVRNQWPLPPSSEKSIDSSAGSCEGCKKVRYTFVGHRQRTALWFSMCMRHQTIIGYHVIAQGEGRRDAMFPIYRFLPEPPEAIFVDFGCGVEETAMNYLPEYFGQNSVLSRRFPWMQTCVFKSVLQ